MERAGPSVVGNQDSPTELDTLGLVSGLSGAEDFQGEVPHDDGSAPAPGAAAPLEPLRAGAVVSVAFAGLVGVLLGYDLGIIAGAMLPIQETFSLTDEQLETFVGVLNLVSLPGSLAGGLLADRLGRLSALRVATLMFLVGNIAQTVAWSYATLVCGRMLAGFAVGVTLTTAPLYCAEISAARLRGLLTTLIEVAYNTGIVLGYVVSWALRNVPDNEVAWRCMLGVGVVPPVIILVGTCCCMYESPRWLASRGRAQDAQDVIGCVLGPIEGRDAISHLQAEAVAFAEKNSEGSEAGCSDTLVGCVKEVRGYFEMLTSPGTRWPAFLGSSVAVLSQVQGVEAILYYSNSILRNAGVAKSQMLLATMFIGCGKLVAILVSGALVDGFGRRPLLIVSSCGMCVCMLVLSMELSGEFRVGAMVTYMVSFSIGYGPITYVLNGEIYPQHCRSRGMSLAMGLGRITAASIAISFLSLERILTEAGTFRLFAGASVVATAFVGFFLPETKGLSLEASALQASGAS